MQHNRFDVSPTGQARVVLSTIFGIMGCMAAALLLVSYTTQFMPDFPRRLTWISAVAMPIFLSGPIFYFFASKLRELAITHAELVMIASRDSLTTCLNRGTFVTGVGTYLTQGAGSEDRSTGALLVIDADNFKSINDRFGHSVGDRALRHIAKSIKAVLQPRDFVGRVGGEEFAVFLPHADLNRAEAVAELIRKRVNSLELSFAGSKGSLSVSVGGTAFVGPVSFDEIFNTADKYLYDAKRRGRNCVHLAPFSNGNYAA
jgi:diguanylate cyclase